ncbi:MAG: YceI family protein [Candidatus Saccharibacteria bacterium]|nr:YceI family protein [Candidatus Saccharibacteria bacterium]
MEMTGSDSTCEITGAVGTPLTGQENGHAWYEGLRMGTAALAAVLLLPMAVSAAPRTWVIDPEHFSIAFSVEHAGFADVMGLFQEAEGRFVYDPETRELESGEVTVQAEECVQCPQGT